MSDNNINLNDLWQGQTAQPMSTSELLRKVNALKASNFRRILFTTLALSLTSLFICWIWLNYSPQLFTTKLGIVLTILSMAIYGYSMNRQYPYLKKLDNANTNLEYLSNLLALRRHQHFLQTTMLNIYFVLLSSGILLYMIEPAQLMSGLKAIAAYALVIGWILFSWVYLRPRQIRKQQARLNEVISIYENIQTQLSKR
jgi:hypothetical protein